jgi:hypothetical protein
LTKMRLAIYMKVMKNIRMVGLPEGKTTLNIYMTFSQLFCHIRPNNVFSDIK